MSFSDFVREHDLKNKATSNIRIQQVLCSLGLDKVETSQEMDRFQVTLESLICILHKVLNWFVI